MTNKLDGLSMNIEQSNLEKLRTVFPDCVHEGKVDIDKLLALLGEYDEKEFEKYRFEWNGKAECLRLAQQRSSGTLRPCLEESVNFDTTGNLYIEGDNLEVLKLLQTSYYRKVKMIYIDPPYNTGNDFVYEDDFADPLARYKEITQQTTKSNPETMGRFHTNWLNMMYPRLRLSANLLRDDGVCFISIDEIEMPNLRKICDEVFGEENHIADFVWHNKRGGGNDAKFVAVEHEYVIMYAKNIGSLDDLFVPYSPKYLSRYKEEDEIGRYFWDTFKRKSGKQYYPITCPDGTVLEKDELGNPISWLRSEARFYDDLKKGETRIISINGKWSVQFKQRIPEGKKPRTIYLEESILDNQGTTSTGSAEMLELFLKNVFSNPKPVELIKHFISFDTKGDDIILDFFSGSATTAHAVMQLNLEDKEKRQFILVQLPENLDKNFESASGTAQAQFEVAIDFLESIDKPHYLTEIGKERIRRAGKKLLEADGQIKLGDDARTPLDVGFKVFKLDSSNLKSWDGTPVEKSEQMQLLDRMNDMIDNVKSDRSDMDMVYEIMLKMGIPLDWAVEKVKINHKTAYAIGENCTLIICLQEGVTADDVTAMCDYAPGKMVFAESCFANDTELANAHYILQDHELDLKLV